MEENRQEQQQAEENKGQSEKRRYPTRRDLYGCVLILLIAIFMQGIQTRALIRRTSENLGNQYQNQIVSIQSQISSIPSGIEAALLEADNPLRESDMEIADVNLKDRTAVIRMTAMPKEWKTGDASLQFYLSCDGEESIPVAADAGADRIFTAEQEIAFCDTLSVSAVLRMGDTEYPVDLGSMSLAGAVYPYFNGQFMGTYTWENASAEAEIKGDILVEVQPGDWMQGKGCKMIEPTAEIYVDGALIGQYAMQAEQEDSYFARYSCTIEDAFTAEAGQTVEVYFKAKDAEADVRYTYLIERSYVEQGDVRIQTSAVDMADVLTVE